MIVLDRVLFVFDKEIDPNVPRHTHDHRHKNHQGGHNGDEGTHQPCPKDQVGDNKGRSGKGHANGIAHIHRTIEEGRFYLILQLAVGTTFLHFENIGEIIVIFVLIHALFMASWTTSC